jgi:hypothetical protein
MGGLVNGSTAKGDLWMIGAGESHLPCYPVGTKSEGPGPRVGHASLLVGNAFIVFGGDTKMDDRDRLDDTLYLLNTCRLIGGIRGGNIVNARSFSTMEEIIASRATPGRPIWAYPEHPRVENLRVRWTSRGLFFQ